jgi:RHS repeat-associated protein
VNKATPTTNWTAPAAITYGTALSATQLNATASVAGTFIYLLPSGTRIYPGTVLTAGTQTLWAIFAPTDTTDYISAGAAVSLTVNKATPVITWATPSAITYGTALNATQLNAAINAAGSFTYSPAFGSIPAAGTQTLSATFTPTDTTDYNSTTATTSLTVNKATPAISWATPAAITYGTALSTSQLNATASVPGSFTYSPAFGSVLAAGTPTLSATFTPTDTTDYNSTTATASLTVNKATPTITWATPAAITYGTALNTTQLNASASVPGTFSYSPASGTVPAGGTRTLSATFTPTDTTDYNTATASITLTVNKATPAISWATPAAITYGTALSTTQLNASASVPGTFSYSPASGTVPAAGTRTLSATFTPTDTTDYNTATASITLQVNKATPTITWSTPAAITYGTALSTTQLNASASVAGAFSYSPTFGTVLTVGTQTLSATFTPTDTTDYNSTTATASLTVNKATPTITWAMPAAITYGAALSATQLNASTSVAGTFAYSPASGTVPTAGTQTLSVTFTPTDTTDYNSATATASLTVNKATPTITWATPAAISYGTTLSTAQLNASAVMPGSFVYSPAAGTIPTVGTQTLSVTFTPTDTTDYSTVTKTVTLTVSRATPTITWSTPSAISYGTVLSSTQLNATANVPGSFTYSPAAGNTMSTVGTQTISATFTPTDTTNYTTATASVSLTINKATPEIVWPTQPAVSYGTTLNDSQLNASVPSSGVYSQVAGGVVYYLPGTFVYSPAFGTILSTVGTQTLSVTFTPTDTTNYTTATATATLQVNKATPAINWATPAAISYGTALSSTQLDATAAGYNGAALPGAFVYSPASGTVPEAGAQVLSTTFTPNDTTDYNPVTAIVTLTVNKAALATPTINWTPPAAISYGTPLSSTQLNATANYGGTTVPGTFEYMPAAGEILDSGSQTLLVAFFPDDSSTYSTAGDSVQITINPSASDSPQTFYSYCIPDISNNYCSSLGYSGTAPGYDGVGNLKNSIDSVTGSWSFSYDTLNRLTTAQNTSTTSTSAQYANNWGCWVYDAFGNRLSQSMSTTACGSSPPLTSWTQYNGTVNGTNNNQMSATNQNGNQANGYDASGDVTNDGTNQYLYDGEGRICAVRSEPMPNNYTMTQYIYDAEGARVAKGAIATWSCDTTTNGFTPTASYILGLSNEQLTETDGQGQWQHTNVYAAGTIIATYDQVSNPLYTNGGTQPAKVPALHFQLEDWLGSRRVQTNINGTVEEWYVSLPYGDGLIPIPNPGCLPANNCYSEDATEHHFTGKERDSESGNDYFGARYYASTMGRFMSPDWAAKAEPVPYAKLDNPQTLNLYAYMRNNPLGGTDPDGHCDLCQKLYNAATGNGWKTDEQVAQKGVNNNVVLVQTSSIPGNKDTKEPDNESVRHVTYTPTKIENGVLKGPVSTDPSDPKVKVSLWESNNGGSYEQQGTTNGSGKDRILTGAGMLSTPVDQHWSVNGERVQVVVGKNADGTVQTTWQLHVDRSGDVPKFTPVSTPAPE